MGRFPRREADVAALASQIITGLTENAEDFPSPPRTVDELQASLDSYKRMLEAAVVAEGAAAEAYDEKDDGLESLTEDMKLVLSYAENATRNDPAKLTALGWDGRRQASSPQAPGQARALEVKREGPVGFIWTGSGHLRVAW